jgi:copper chaperone CopZ
MKAEPWTTGGAVLAAFIASLCCIGPLLFAALGVGAFSAAALFAAARPYLLGVAIVALGFGFYRTYFRRAEACAPGEACETRPANKAGRAGLWIASVAVVAFALSPWYAGALAHWFSAGAATPSAQPQSAQPQAAAAQQTAGAQVAFKVSGMTCTSCETTVRLALEGTPGVRRAEVSYQRGEAVVTYDPNATTTDKLRDAINQTGYKVEGVR